MLLVVLLDGGAVANADHDAVRQRGAQRSVQRELLPLVQSGRRLVQEHRPRLGQQHPRERDPLLLTRGEHLGPIETLVQPGFEMAQCHRVQCRPNRRVIDIPGLGRIGDDRAQIAERHIRQLGQEHRLVLVGGVAHRSGGVRPQLGQAAQQGGLAAAGPTGDHQRVTRGQPHIERIDELLASR